MSRFLRAKKDPQGRRRAQQGQTVYRLHTLLSERSSIWDNVGRPLIPLQEIGQHKHRHNASIKGGGKMCRSFYEWLMVRVVNTP
jgi:hypothetical protein